MKSKSPIVVATDLRFSGSQERAVGSNGELNASSKRDLIANQLKLISVTASGGVITEQDAIQRKKDVATHRQLVQAAFNSKQAHVELGEVLATNLYQAGNRRGFARKFVARQELVQGQIPMAKLRMKNVTAVYATAPAKVESQIIRDKLFTPPEIILEARPFIEQREINTSNGDVLEEKYMESLEAIMVGEDRLWKAAADAMVGLDNDQQIISGTLTPLGLMEVRNQTSRWNLPVPHLLMASDLYTDIVGDSSFIQAIEPVARHELIMTGELAVLYGMAITSDAYRHPEHRVLAQGEFYAISDPTTHGQYTDRGGIDTEILTGATEKMAGRGWWMFESFSLVIANARSVSKGIRV
jgi:hypothetical protein